MLNRLSIRTKLALVAIVPLFAMAALAVLASTTLNAVKVGGAAEQRVVDSHSVVEDVLPPPLFVVEPFLVISLASEPENAARRDELLAQYASLKQEYSANHEKWMARALPAELRTSLLEDSYDSATRFFAIIDTKVIPAIQRDDDSAPSIVAADLVPVFNEHRGQILTVIEQSRQYEKTERASVAGAIRSRTIVFVGGLVLAALVSLLLGLVISRTIRRSIARLRRAATEDLPRVMEQLRHADDDALASHTLEPVDLGTRDELADAADAFNAVIGTAIGLAGEQTIMRKQTSEMFVNLGRRNQNLVSRQLRFIDSLERTETDGDRLAELFRLDNLATRMRRNAESLLVLAGVEAPRRWRKPVRLYDVVRAAMAEIEDFRRVKIGTFDEVQVQGASVANVTHLLAELIENAARFSPPDADVAISGVDTGNGYFSAIAVIQALLHRQKTGNGQAVDTSIINAGLLVASMASITADGSPLPRPALDAMQLGLHAAYRLYPTADHEWICMAALTAVEWSAFTNVVGHPGAARATTDLHAFDSWFAARTAADAWSMLDSAGVPCEIADEHYAYGAPGHPGIHDDPDQPKKEQRYDEFEACDRRACRSQPDRRARLRRR